MNDKEFITLYFSKDRPLQLDLTIKTNLFHREEEGNIPDEIVLYTTSDQSYENSYQKLKSEYNWIKFVRETNFKENLLEIVNGKKYILFVVDDTIFVRKYSMADIEKALSFSKTLGFSLRLGYNTVNCYPINQKNEKPHFIEVKENNNFYIYDWTKIGIGDFGYPLELSSSAYRVSDISELLNKLNYNNPNSLEWLLSINTGIYRQKYPMLACYYISASFSNPANKVQDINNNRVSSNPNYRKEKLLKYFEMGYRINMDPFKNYISNGCHQEVDFEFILQE